MKVKKHITKIYQIVITDWKIKLIVFAIACSLWVGVTAKEQRINLLPYNFPIEIRNINNSFSVSLDKKTVKLRVSTDRNTFQKISPDKIHTYIDLSSIEKGTFDVKIRATSTLANVKIIEIIPSTVLVTTEKIDQKEFPVVITLEGKVADGKNVSQATPSNTTAIVKGSTNELEAITEVRGSVKLSNQTDNFEQEVSLLAVDNQGTPHNNLSIIPEKTNVKINIVPTENIKSVPIRLSTQGTVATGFYIDNILLTPAIINIIGEPATINKIDAITAGPLNISDANEDINTRVTLTIPNGILTENNISTTQAKISIVRSDISKALNISVNTSGLASDRRIKNIDPAVLSIVVSGDQDAVNAAKAEDFSITLDLTGKDKGEYSFDINKQSINKPNNLNVLSVLPSKVKITVE